MEIVDTGHGQVAVAASNIVQFVDGSGGRWPWSRQLPGASSVWEGSQYIFDQDENCRAQWLVVFSSWDGDTLRTSIPLERRIFVAGEPESFHRYQVGFLNQFGTVLTTQRKTLHANPVFSQVGINWFAGVEFLDGGRYQANLVFENFLGVTPQKSKLCSVVTSGKTMTAGHRGRHEFVQLLKERLGHQIDFYGRDSTPVADKDLALSGYRYHIALENSISQDYWTEKLADPLLRGCFPLYSGCPNVADYFPKGSYCPIDMDAPEQAVATIAAVLASDTDLLNASALAIAKNRLLFEHNVFALLERVYEQVRLKYPQPAFCPLEVLYSDHHHKDQKFSRRLRRSIRQFFGKGQ